MGHRVKVVERFKGYEPPINVSVVTATMLDSVPERFLAGLSSVVLTNFSGLPSRSRKGKGKSRGRKFAINSALGFYRQEWQGQGAYVELFVDKILGQAPPLAWKFPPLRDVFFGETLYHEIGHHIHKVHQPEHRETEDVAELWAKRLSGAHFKRKYWYFIPAAWTFVKGYQFITRLRQRLGIDKNRGKTTHNK